VGRMPDSTRRADAGELTSLAAAGLRMRRRGGGGWRRAAGARGTRR
jgi:hypothetical protein